MAEKGIVSEILRQKMTRSTEKNKEDQVKRTSIMLPTSLYRLLKAYAAFKGRKLNELMVEMLREGLEKRLEKEDLLKEWRV